MASTTTAPARQPAFQPYVPASQSPAEFTVKAIVIGSLFGLLFGASGVGLAIGSFAGGMLAERRAIGLLYGPSIILAGIGYGLAAIAPNVWLAVPWVGVGSSATDIAWWTR